jgi:flagellar secretion chaperone FliS
MFAPYRSQAKAYSTVHMETSVGSADPHQLIGLLIDGALSAIGSAYNAIERGDLSSKCKAISRAVGIVDEGLRGSLDRKRGGAVAKTLDDLYACVLLRLTQANLNNDLAMLRECNTLLAPLRDAWGSIRPQPLAA